MPNEARRYNSRTRSDSLDYHEAQSDEESWGEASVIISTVNNDAASEEDPASQPAHSTEGKYRYLSSPQQP
eukprot:CAMPEP_0184683692 /NCGR_PEP_ID=MMETSP0312-20130426/12219_1 /TAXON_ID=31354 /ORGANISM="Compsopogon coeruleus, Strain SAG 36.94" /LENGTH=70 /DNA_ID=CAMNT_0027136209 /DNA_START=354 /DNA_END=566 /DNA_ORIENTATION=+